MSYINKKHALQGFTLIEIAAVVLIFGLITTAAIVLGSAWIKKETFDSAKLQLETIELAMDTYRKLNDRLPCPANFNLTPGDANYGEEAAVMGDCTSSTPAAQKAGTSETVFGAIPTKTLGLGDSLLVDPWGNRFVYYVDKRMTENNAFITYEVDNQIVGDITIQDRNDPPNTRTQKAIYALLSHGANGRFAFRQNGVRDDQASPDIGERVNYNYDPTTSANDRTLVQGFVDEEFDDLVFFKLRRHFPNIWVQGSGQDCAGEPTSWGGGLCIGTVNTLGDGETQLVRDSESLQTAEQGTAIAKCENGTISYSYEFCSASTCTGTAYWDNGGAAAAGPTTCGASPQTDYSNLVPGETFLAVDTGATYTGTATVTCQEDGTVAISNPDCGQQCAATSPGDNLSWTSGTYSCAGDTSLPVPHGDTSLVQDITGSAAGPDYLGYANYKCENGTLIQTGTKSCGPTCIGVAWDGASAHCENPTITIADTVSVPTVDNTLAGVSGQANTVQCNGGSISIGSSTCVASGCSGGPQGWTVGGNYCEATIGDTAEGASVTASDTTAMLVGTATYQCNDGVLTEQAGATCMEGSAATSSLTALRAWSWGDNSDGELGMGVSNSYMSYPVLIQSDRLVQLAGGSNHACALDSTNTAWCWGDNTNGQFGNGTSGSDSNVPMELTGHTFTYVGAGSNHSCGLKTGGVAWCWGADDRGQLGNGADGASDVPVQVSGGHVFDSLDVTHNAACGIKSNGEAWCWGVGIALGNGDVTFADSPVPTLVAGGHSFTQISIGHDHVCGLDDAGAAWCWGTHVNGRLGSSPGSDQHTPIAVSGGHTFQKVTAGHRFSCGLLTNGQVYCWGDSGWLSTGTLLGDGSTSPRNTPGPVSGGNTFVDVESNYLHTCALTADGRAFCWGEGDDGRLGDNTITDRPTPTLVSGGRRFSSIVTGGGFTLGLEQDGNPLCPVDLVGYWMLDETTGTLAMDDSGNGNHGTLTNMNPATDWMAGNINGGLEVGLGDKYISIPSSTSLDITGELTIAMWIYKHDLNGWDDVLTKTNVAGDLQYLLATDDNEILFGFCNGVNGDCDGFNNEHYISTTDANLSTGIWYHVAVTYDDTANAIAMYVNGAPRSTLVTFGDPLNQSIPSSTASLRIGRNLPGQDTEAVLDDVRIYSSALSASEIAEIAASTSGACSAGPNCPVPYIFDFTDQVNATVSTLFTDDVTLTGLSASDTATVSGGGAEIRKNSTGAWGTSVAVNPGDVLNIRMTSSASAGMAVAAVVTIGSDSADWIVTTMDEPCAVYEKVATITTGYANSCAIGKNGKAYCWGHNLNGQNGNNTLSGNALEPEEVQNGENPDGLFTEIIGGAAFTCALGANEKAYCWGQDSSDQLGNNNESGTGSALPVEVHAGENTGGLFTHLASVSTQYLEHVCGIGKNGKAYCWGANDSGQLGDNSQTQRAEPVQVEAGANTSTTYTQVSTGGFPGISQSCGVGTDGEIYCWGSNGVGQLGDGTTTSPRLVPVKVVAGAKASGEYTQVVVGVSHACGLVDDGKVFCWGSNGNGQLGNNSIMMSTSPVQTVAGDSPGTFIAIGAGSSYTCGIGTDYKAYCWGENSVGTLGDGTTMTRLVPTLVQPGENISGTFVAIAPSYDHTCALGMNDIPYCWGNGSNGRLGNNSTSDSLMPAQVHNGQNSSGFSAPGCYTDNGGGSGDSCALEDLSQYPVCTASNSGPLAELAYWDPHGDAEGHNNVTSDGTYFYTANSYGNNGLAAISYDGTTPTMHHNHHTGSGGYEGVAVLDGVIHVLQDGYGMRAYTFNGTTLSHVGSLPLAISGDPSYDQHPVYSDGNYVYVGSTNMGLIALSYDTGTNTYTLLDNDTTNVTGEVGFIEGDGTYIYLIDWGSGRIRAFTFDGTTLTQAGSIASSAVSLWSDGDYVYAGRSSNLQALSFDGTTFTPITTYATTAAVIDVWGDGLNIYVGVDGTAGTNIVRFNGTTFTEIENPSPNIGQWTRRMAGDGQHVLLACDGHLTFLKNYACTAVDSGASCGASGSGADSCSSPDDLIFHWKMDETTGTALTEEINGTTSTWQNGAGVVGATGQIDGALTFSGAANNYVNAGSTAPTDNMQVRTVCAWVKPDSLPCDFPVILNKSSDGYNGWNFYLSDVGPQPGFGFFTPMNDATETYGALTMGSWQHICATWNGANGSANIKFYHNGTSQTLAGTWDSAGTLNDAANNLTIGLGQVGVGACNFDGDMDDVRIYDRELTAPEILDLYNFGGYGGSCTPTISDTTPDDFVFANETAATASTQYAAQADTSGSYIVTGFDDTLTASVTGGNGAEIRNGTTASAWGATADVSDGQILEIRTTSSAVSGATVTATVTLGSVSANWSVTTECTFGTGSCLPDMTVTASDGAAWGGNANGQLGDNSMTQRTAPVDISGGHQFTQVSAGYLNHSCGVTAGGEAWCWGKGSDGQLGNNNTTDRDEPSVVYNINGFLSAQAGGDHSCGLQTSGYAWCWGLNNAGQLGNGNNDDQSTPVEVSGHQFVQIALGLEHSCGLDTDGAAWCWGGNASGQLGNGNLGSASNVPVAVADGHEFIQIDAGFYHTCGMTADSTVWCWGQNSFGQLGDNAVSGTESDVPVQVSTTESFVYIASGGAHNCALTQSGNAFCWGKNDNEAGQGGQIGDGSTTQRNAPVAVTMPGSGFNRITAGGYHSCGMSGDGTAYCWGANSAGALGVGDTSQRLTPTAVSGSDDYALLDGGFTHTLAVKGTPPVLSGCGTSACLPSLAHHWTLDESPVSDPITNSVGANNGTVTGTITSVAGTVGTAFNFSYDGIVDVGIIPSLVSAQKFTLSTWMKRTAANQPVLVAAQGVDANHYIGIEAYGDGLVHLGLSNGIDTLGSFPLNDTAWHHIVMAYDGTQTGNANRLKAYVDGAPVAMTYSGTIPATTSATAYPLLIGAAWGGSDLSNGQIDEIQIYSDALTDAQVADLYAAQSGGNSCPTDSCTPAFTGTFDFTDDTGVLVGSIQSDSVVLSGFAGSVTAEVFGGGAQIRKNGGGAWGSTVSVEAGDTLNIQMTASGSAGTSEAAVVSLGDIAWADWVVTTTGGSDTSPDAFDFTDQTGVATSTQTDSNIVQITGMDNGTAISVTGGQYRVCNDATCSAAPAFTGTAGTINASQYVQLRVTSSGSASTAVTVNLTVGTVTADWSVTTGSACIPCGSGGCLVGGYCWYASALDDSCNAACTSLGGCNSAGTINYAGSSGSDANCTSVLVALGLGSSVDPDTDSDTGAGCLVTNTGQRRRIVTPATTCSANRSDFRRACACNTGTPDTTPNAFDFTDQTGVATSTQTDSNIVQITGMDNGTAISVSGGQYRICSEATCITGSPAFTGTAGTINAGQYVQLRVTSSASNSTTVTANLTIGTVTADWAVTTIAAACAHNTWTARDSNRNWYSITSSADGTKQAATVDGGQIYTSTDSGLTWTARASNRAWYSITSSADGTKLAAVVSGGQIYTSTDSGVTWTARDSNRNWAGIASSADGTKLAATVANGQIYTSTDSGLTWTARASNRHWMRGIASSADGTKLAAVVYNGQIYTSTDSGLTWTARASNRFWQSIASSADGTKLAAVVASGQIYTSTDSGVTWTARDSNRSWHGIASSADGTRLAAVTLLWDRIYVSTDSGVTWSARAGILGWTCIASSADGNKLTAGVPNGQLYTSSCP